MKLHFVRHGETDHNAKAVITSGNPGNPINSRGQEQATRTASQLANLPIDAVYTSPLLRARGTAAIVAAACGVDVRESADLRETDVGELEGRGDAAAFERFTESLDRWYLEEDLHVPVGPGGESARAVLERVCRFLATLPDRHDPDVEIVVVSHQTLLQLVLTLLPENVQASFGHRRWLTNGGVSTLEINGDAIRCLVWDGRPISDFEEPSA